MIGLKNYPHPVDVHGVFFKKNSETVATIMARSCDIAYFCGNTMIFMVIASKIKGNTRIREKMREQRFYYMTGFRLSGSDQDLCGCRKLILNGRSRTDNKFLCKLFAALRRDFGTFQHRYGRITTDYSRSITAKKA
jgi:hypothetical protein